jgi:pilus assembly protein Flp/PilA
MNAMLCYARIRLSASVRSERGASAVEYGLLVALIAIAIIVAVTLLGGTLSDIFTNSGNELNK